MRCFFIPANSHALGVSLTHASWKLHSHTNSRLLTKFSCLDEKLKHFPKRWKLTPIRETKTPCNWKSKWVPDEIEISNFYNARFQSRTLNHFLQNFRIIQNVFGHHWKSSENFGYSVVFGNPGTLWLKISCLRLRKSWQVYSSARTTHLKLAISTMILHKATPQNWKKNCSIKEDMKF